MWVTRTTVAKDETLFMTTVTEMLGGGQVLLGLNYDAQVLFEERLSDEQRLLLAILRLVEDEKAGLPRSGRYVAGHPTTRGRS